MEHTQREEFLSLANRMVQLRYSMDSDHLGIIFSEISMPDYMMLIMLSKKMGIHEPNAKVYLSEISTQTNMPITKVSKLVQNLQDKGYVYWRHDNDGSQGTYIFLSETGAELLKKQQEILHRYFKIVIERMGYDKFVQVLELMLELETVMEEEAMKL